MALISTTVPNIIDGVSQQPHQNRLPSQGEAQVNMSSDVVEGLSKRNPVEYVASLYTGTLGSSFVHAINRDTDERYVVAIIDGDLKVYDTDGVEKTVAFPDGKTYLDVVDPESEFAVTTIGDYTFVVNKTKTVLMDDDDRSDELLHDALIVCDFAQKPDNNHHAYIDANGTNVMYAQTGSPSEKRTAGYISATLSNYVTEPSVAGTVDNYADLPDASTYGGSNGDYYKVRNKPTKYRWKEIFPESPAATWEGEDRLGYSASESSMPDPEDVFNDYTPDASGVYKWEVGYGRFFDVESKVVLFPYTYYQVDTTADTWTRAGEASAFRDGVVWYSDDAEFNMVLRATNVATTGVGYDQTEIQIIQRSVESIQDLPITAPRGFKVEVKGEEGSASYWVEHDQVWSSGEFFASGYWVETIGPQVRKHLNHSTMPHVLVREADGTFTFKIATWDERKVGDEVSNAAPSFVGNTINDIFLFENRLGVCAGTGVTLTQAGSFFNFFRTSVVQLLDEDRIDVAASSRKVTPLRFAIPFDEKLLVFSDETQLILKGGDILSSKTVSFEIVSEYRASRQAKPVGAGERIYFPANNDAHSAIYEFLIDPDTLEESAQETTAHCPRYVPSDVRQMVADATSGIVAAVCETETDTIWVYRFYFSGQKKLQSSWSKWEFAGANVLGMAIIDETLFLVNQYSDAVYLEKINLVDGAVDTGSEFKNRLDRRVTEADCTVAYSAGTGLTTFTLPYDIPAGAVAKVVTRVGSTTEGIVPALSSQGTDTVVVEGDYSAENCYIGIEYRGRFRFSQPYPSEGSQDGSRAPIGEGRLQILHWTLWIEKTGNYVFKVGYDFRDAVEETFTGYVSGNLTVTVGDVPLNTLRRRHAVMAENKQCYIEVYSDSHLPLRLTAVEWEALYHSRSTRSSRI